ncbi:MAG: response regulator [Bacteroidota bacterium]|nr:response regulator [Bacteroidota bacterium]
MMPEKVLLVDDDEITHIIGKRVFKVTSFANEILTLTNGKEAIDYFDFLVNGNKDKKESAPDVVFLDINMPLMSGWDFLEDFTKLYYSHFPSINIFMLSSSVDPEDIERSKNYSSVKDYIVKPLTKETIEHVLLKIK